MRRLLTASDGIVGGAEVLAFGVLVFVVGSLLVVNAWAVIDAKMAVATAARQAVRAVVEAPANVDVAGIAGEAAREAMAAHGRSARRPVVSVQGSLARCARVRVSVSYELPALRLPWIGAVGATTARSTASEIVDPLRSGLAGEALCVGG